MSKVLVTESYLDGIADAIRLKNGASTTYRPGDMAQAIYGIDTSGITPSGTINITENGTIDVTQYASANVEVPNSYTSSDEGKVVSSGALIAQTSSTITENGTYDTTEINEIVVDVSSGGGGSAVYLHSVTLEASNDTGKLLIVSGNAAPFTLATLKTWFSDGGFTQNTIKDMYPAIGSVGSFSSSNNRLKGVFFNESTSYITLVAGSGTSANDWIVTDKVVQV